MACFNPLDRGNSNQIEASLIAYSKGLDCFNPLDRGNSNQMAKEVDNAKLVQQVSIP